MLRENDFWENVIFSDEKVFQSASNGRCAFTGRGINGTTRNMCTIVINVISPGTHSLQYELDVPKTIQPFL
ncbi:unnamed protein product [Tenebrio molitor]|nr:unnamed protein product [Tenebrio molitor]